MASPKHFFLPLFVLLKYVCHMAAHVIIGTIMTLRCAAYSEGYFLRNGQRGMGEKYEARSSSASAQRWADIQRH